MSLKYSGEFKRDLISSFNADLLLPLYSVFLPLLATTLKASVFEVGVVGGAANAVYCFMPFVIGRFSNRKSVRRFFVTCSFAVLSIVSVSYIFVQNPVSLMVARVFEGIGWAMLWPAIESAIRDSTSDAKKALSTFNFVWSGAAAAGPLLGAVLVVIFSIRDAFVVTSGIMIATVVLNLFPIATRNREKFTEMQPSEQVVAHQDVRLGVRFYMSSTILAAVSSGVLYTFASAKSIGVSVLVIGVATFMFGFARFLVYVLTVRQRFRLLILDVRNRARNIIVSLAILSASSLLVILHDPVIYVVVYGIAGASYSVVYAVSQAAMIAEASPERVGRGAGMFESSIGIGQFFGPVVAGFGALISGNSFSTLFLVPSLGFMVFLAALPVIARRPS